MRLTIAFLCIALWATTSLSQVRYPVRSGENKLDILVLNRTNISSSQLTARIVRPYPNWLSNMVDITGSLASYSDEHSLVRNGTLLSIPMYISGTADGVVRVQLLRDHQPLGEFDVVLSFGGASGPSFAQGSSAATMSFEPEQAFAIPSQFALRQNYPNPFNPSTVIEFDVPTPSHVMLKIFDMLGREVRTLVDGERSAGVHHVSWDGKDQTGLKLSTGVYLFRLTAGSFVETRRMVLLQ